jgi:hypothetical protein
MPLREVLVRARGRAAILAAKSIYRQGEEAGMLVGVLDPDRVQI